MHFQGDCPGATYDLIDLASLSDNQVLVDLLQLRFCSGPNDVVTGGYQTNI
jgi:hypothetical protein